MSIFKFKKMYLPNGTHEEIYVEIGGISQFMQIRGNDITNPVVLWLHGGPGFPLTYMNYYYQQKLEKDFTIVCLEQRGCGRTYYKNNKIANATIDILLSDLDNVVEYLKDRFNKDKIIIMGQSWGTVIGMKYLEKNPHNVAAYFGIGQVTQFALGKLYSAKKASIVAQNQGKTKDADYLNKLYDDFSSVTSMDNINIKKLEKMIIYSDKYLKSRGEMSPFKRITTALFSPHMNFYDAKWFMFASSTKNIISTQRELMEYLYFGFNIYDIVLPDNVPLFFIQGDCDYITPTDMVQEFYDSIKVNSTDMIIIEKAGHTPFLDNPEVFCESVKKCNGGALCKKKI